MNERLHRGFAVPQIDPDYVAARVTPDPDLLGNPCEKEFVEWARGIRRLREWIKQRYPELTEDKIKDVMYHVFDGFGDRVTPKEMDRRVAEVLNPDHQKIKRATEQAEAKELERFKRAQARRSPNGSMFLP